jgi:hypothetical protein
LGRLSCDNDEWVRDNVAANPNTSPETLVWLSCDEDWSVRCMAVRNPNIPKYIKIHYQYNNYLNLL